MGMTTGKVVPPPARVPVAVLDVPAVRGESLVLWVLDPTTGRHDYIRGYRGWTEVYEIAEGPVIEVVPERVWFEFEITGRAPDKVRQWPARGAWIA